MHSYRGHSRTTLFNFAIFWPPSPSAWTKTNIFWIFSPLLLVHVVIEWPLRTTSVRKLPIKGWSNWANTKKPSLKVSKSQKQFFLKLHCPRNEQNTRQNSALWSWGRNLSNISFIFWAMEVQEKMLLRFTDLYYDVGINLESKDHDKLGH